MDMFRSLLSTYLGVELLGHTVQLLIIHFASQNPRQQNGAKLVYLTFPK